MNKTLASVVMLLINIQYAICEIVYVQLLVRIIVYNLYIVAYY